MLPGAALPAAAATEAAAASRRVAGQPGGRDVLAHVGVGQGAGEEVHRVVHQGGLRLKQFNEMSWSSLPTAQIGRMGKSRGLTPIFRSLYIMK